MTEPKSPTFADAWIGSAARPDPLVVAEALTDLMTNAQAAWRTALGQAVTPQALPYDPLALGKAIVDFNTALMLQPASLLEAQGRALTEWTAPMVRQSAVHSVSARPCASSSEAG